jgi:glucans biosynthesis protein C
VTERATERAEGAGRFVYLDNLKVLLVVGVIAVHTAIIYGVDGAFYLEDFDSMSDVSVGVLTAFVAVGFLFGLGTFFLVAGRLSGPSLDRKGPGRFVRDRLVRLGIPVVFYILLLAPVMEYVKARDEGADEGFVSFAWGQLSDPAPGPTWFLEALLAFSLAYALIRALRPADRPVSRRPLRGGQVVTVGVAIGVLSFATRLVVPYGEEHLHIQFALFPQYAILFGLGCAAGRRGWLETLTPELRRRCGVVGLIGILGLPVLLLAGGFTEDATQRDLYAGGWHWQSAGAAVEEATLAATLPLFLVGWFREHWTGQGPLLKRMSDAAYGAFIIHPPVIVGLALHRVAIPAELKFALVLAGGVAASFGLIALVLSSGVVRRVIGSGPRPSSARSPKAPLAARPVARVPLIRAGVGRLGRLGRFGRRGGRRGLAPSHRDRHRRAGRTGSERRQRPPRAAAFDAERRVERRRARARLGQGQRPRRQKHLVLAGGGLYALVPDHRAQRGDHDGREAGGRQRRGQAQRQQDAAPGLRRAGCDGVATAGPEADRLEELPRPVRTVAPEPPEQLLGSVDEEGPADGQAQQQSSDVHRACIIRHRCDK